MAEAVSLLPTGEKVAAKRPDEGGLPGEDRQVQG